MTTEDKALVIVSLVALLLALLGSFKTVARPARWKD